MNNISILINILHGHLLMRLVLLRIYIRWSTVLLLLIIWRLLLILRRLLISGRMFLEKRNHRSCYNRMLHVS